MSTNYGQVYRPLDSEDVDAIRYFAMVVAVDLLLYGVQITLSAAAITILARRHGRSRFTLVAIVGLLLSSTIYAVDNTVFYLVQFPVYIGTSERSIHVLLYRLSILLSVSQILIFVLSDAVLVWRAWCLWPDWFLAKCTLSLCMGGTIVGSSVETTWNYWPSLYHEGTIESTGPYLTRFIPLLTTNIVATVLIGKKVLKSGPAAEADSAGLKRAQASQTLKSPKSYCPKSNVLKTLDSSLNPHEPA